VAPLPSAALVATVVTTATAVTAAGLLAAATGHFGLHHNALFDRHLLGDLDRNADLIGADTLFWHAVTDGDRVLLFLFLGNHDRVGNLLGHRLRHALADLVLTSPRLSAALLHLHGAGPLFRHAGGNAVGAGPLLWTALLHLHGAGPLFWHALRDAVGTDSLFWHTLRDTVGAGSLLFPALPYAYGAGPLFLAALRHATGVGNLFGHTLIGCAGHFLCLDLRNPDPLAAHLRWAGVAASIGAAGRHLHHLVLPPTTADLNRLGCGDRHPLLHGAGLLNLLCVGHHHRIGLFNLFGVGNLDRVGAGLLFLYRLHHGVGAGLFLLHRHHHRVGLLNFFPVGNHDGVRPGLLLRHRHHHGVGLLNFLAVGNLNLIFTGPRFHHLLVDRAFDGLGPSLRHAHGHGAGPLFGPGHLLHDRVGPFPGFFLVLCAGDSLHFRHVLPLADSLGATTGTCFSPLTRTAVSQCADTGGEDGNHRRNSGQKIAKHTNLQSQRKQLFETGVGDIPPGPGQMKSPLFRQDDPPAGLLIWLG